MTAFEMPKSEPIVLLILCTIVFTASRLIHATTPLGFHNYMKFSDYLSIAALAVSILSIIGTFYFNLRDRVKIKATSKFYLGLHGSISPKVEIKVVNKGRRPAVITMFGGNLEDGEWNGTHLGKEGHLAENQIYKVEFLKDDLLAVYPGRDSNYTELWFEDSHGQRYKVKNSKKNIKLLQRE